MEKNMKKYTNVIFKRIAQILIIAAICIFIDYLIVLLSHDDSIWLGEAIEAVASIIFGPVVGFFATLISCITTDYLAYRSFDYSFVGIFEASAMALIGLIYRNLIKDEDKFGVREIVVFNFVQILVNTLVIYLSTPPAAVMFFGFIVEEWTMEDFVIEMTALRNDAFSACISVALIGTVLLAAGTVIRRELKKHGSLSAAFHSIFKTSYLKREYRSRSVEYSIGFLFAVALSMVDGVVSGQVLGMDALAATSLVFPLVSLTTFLSNIITTGCSNLCAIAKGNGDHEKAKKLFTLGLFTTILLGLLQSVIYYFTEDLYFNYYAAPGNIGTFAREYYRYYVLVPPFMAVTVFLDEIISSEGDDMLSYGGYMASFAVNVVMSILLSRKMGMGGLALGTMISYVCYLLVVSVHFLKKSNTYKLRPYFSIRDLFLFAKFSLKTNSAGLCMFAVSVAFTKAILLFMGTDYLIANTVLCAMLEIYQIMNGPSEAAEYLFATYTGEKNGEGIKILFKEALTACVFIGMIFSLLLLLMPNLVLSLYGIEDSPLEGELIKCIRYCSVGLIAASVGGFLSDYYGDTEKPLWSCMMVVFRTALFPILFCVTFILDGGIIGMGIGMLLAQIFAVAVFYGFIFIVKGGSKIPYMLEDPDFEKVKMNSFEFAPADCNEILKWIGDNLKDKGVEDGETEEVIDLIRSIFKETETKRGTKKVLGECVLRFIGEPEIIIKDNGELFDPDIKDDRYSYNMVLSCNNYRISLGKTA